MAWNKDLPQDSSKLRLSANYIRQNWTALEEGTTPYQYLKLSERGANPTRADDTGWLYTKQSSSQTELFYMDDRNPALATQLTFLGAVGSPTGVMYTQFMSYNGGSTFIDKNKAVLGWLLVNAAGAAIGSSKGIDGVTPDMTVARSAQGIYTVAFTLATTSAYVVQVTLNNTSSRRSCAVINTLAAAFQVQIYSNSTGSNEDEPFQVIVFGGR